PVAEGRGGPAGPRPRPRGRRKEGEVRPAHGRAPRMATRPSSTGGGAPPPPGRPGAPPTAPPNRRGPEAHPAPPPALRRGRPAGPYVMGGRRTATGSPTGHSFVGNQSWVALPRSKTRGAPSRVTMKGVSRYA